MYRFCSACICMLLLIGSALVFAEKSSLTAFTVKKIRLSGVQDHPLQNISENGLEVMINLWRQKNYPQKKLGLNQLDDLAYRVAKFYQDAGFSFVTAIVPKQKITRGVVFIQVKEDVLADISVRNVSRDQRTMIVSEFKYMLGRPVFKPDLEEPILLLNDNPNREVFAYFSRGKNKGETRLNLNVKETQLNTLSLGVNNTGPKATGNNQWWCAANIKNPLGWNDAIKLNFNQSMSNENNVSGVLSYEKFKGSRESYSYNLSHNEYQLGEDLAVLELHGEYTSLGGRYKNKSVRTFSLSNSHVFSLDYRQSELSSNVVSSNYDQKNSALVGAYQYVSTDYKVLLGDYITKSVQLSAVVITQDDDQLTDDAFLKFNGFFQSGQNIGSYVPGLNSRFSSKLALQYSVQTLPSADKSSLTGRNGVRAFESGVFSADESVVLQLKLSSGFRHALGNLEPFAFYDYAYGVRKANNEEIGAQLSGFGLGLVYTLSSWLKIDSSYAISQKTKIGDLNKNRQSLFLISLESQVF